MTAAPIRLLLLEDNPGDARLVQTTLADEAPGEFAITTAERLADALARIQTERFDVVLCDLGLPDSTGLGTAQAIVTGAPALPLVVLTGSHNEDLGRAAIELGAQDYLVKGESGGVLITRSLRYAIERKHLELELLAEETARESDNRLRVALSNINMAVFHQDCALRYTWMYQPQLGYLPEQIIGRTDAELLPPEAAGRITELKQRVLETGEIVHEEVRVELKDTTFFYDLTAEPRRDGSGAIVGLTGVTLDITERRRAEKEARETLLLLELVVQSSPMAIITHDSEGKIKQLNPAAEKLLGWSAPEVVGKLPPMIPPEQQDQFREAFSTVFKRDSLLLEAAPVLRKDGSRILCDIAVGLLRGAQSEIRGVVAILNNITERKRAEEHLHESEERFRSLVSATAQIVWTTDSAGNVPDDIPSWRAYTGQAIEQVRGARWAEALHPDDVERTLAIWKRAVESGSNYAVEYRVRRHDGQYHHFAVRGVPLLNADGSIREWVGYCADITERRLADEAVVRAAAELATANEKLIFENREKEKRAAELAIANEKLAFENQEKDKRAAELVIANKQLAFENEEKAKRAAELAIANEELHDALLSTVEVVTALSEMRDPYTTGHERRVADIAVAIGAELGFDERRQEGVRIAGYLHDVGKINIPAEILAKPGKLSPIQYALIQGHAQAGYDVLKTVKFPWPVAEIALQHHERMDGSGYPQGLKGEAILFEARIMAVADVVEAMSSHRPYRPGLGVEAALAEIERGSGILYDAQVAAACLKLFREKGYTIPGSR